MGDYMECIYTIGFTKKSAKKFFGLLKENQIELLLDVRLNNTSQLAGFSKYPDIEFFLNEICQISYISDTHFAPEEWLLKEYKSKKIDWNQYVKFFDKIMDERDITNYIKHNYTAYQDNRICLLCSEEKAENCHRYLVAQKFVEVFNCKIINL